MQDLLVSGATMTQLAEEMDFDVDVVDLALLQSVCTEVESDLYHRVGQLALFGADRKPVYEDTSRAFEEISKHLLRRAAKLRRRYVSQAGRMSVFSGYHYMKASRRTLDYENSAGNNNYWFFYVFIMY